MERCGSCVLPQCFVRCSEVRICAFCFDDDHKLTYKGKQALVGLQPFTDAEEESFQSCLAPWWRNPT